MRGRCAAQQSGSPSGGVAARGERGGLRWQKRASDDVWRNSGDNGRLKLAEQSRAEARPEKASEKRRAHETRLDVEEAGV